MANSEQCLLGMCLQDATMVGRVASKVRPEDFGSDRRRKLFDLMVGLDRERPGSADAVMVSNMLEQRGLTEEIVDRDGLKALMTCVPSTAYAETHIEAVLEAARLRGISDTLLSAKALLDAGRASDEVAQYVDERMSEAQTRRGAAALVSVNEADREYRDMLRRRAGQDRPTGMMPTQIGDLNHMLGGGLFPGELVVVAGRAAMGKTIFAEGLAESAARFGKSLYFSLEMDRFQLMERAYRRAHGQPLPSARTAYGAQAEAFLAASEHASGKLRGLSMVYCDDYDVDFGRIRGEALNLRRQGDLRMVVIDYLQLVRISNPTRSRQEDVARLSRDFKRLARELQVPVVMLAQLNRQLENRDDKTPRLSDLRESGAIEQDADRVLLLHRPSYFDQDSRETDKVVVAKNRHGETGLVQANFNPDRMTWENRPWNEM